MFLTFCLYVVLGVAWRFGLCGENVESLPGLEQSVCEPASDGTLFALALVPPCLVLVVGLARRPRRQFYGLTLTLLGLGAGLLALLALIGS